MVCTDAKFPAGCLYDRAEKATAKDCHQLYAVSKKRQIMGYIARYPTLRNLNRSRIGVPNLESLTGRGGNVHISSADNTDFHTYKDSK